VLSVGLSLDQNSPDKKLIKIIVLLKMGIRKATATYDRCFSRRKAYFAVFKMSRNSFAVTMNGFAGKCFILPVTRYA